MNKVNIAGACGGAPAPRSCARCGNSFHTRGKEYTCHACRQPKGRPVHKPGHALSFREQQIVALIAEAKANKEIAYDLCLSEGTVKDMIEVFLHEAFAYDLCLSEGTVNEYLYHIFRKLKVTSRTELALRFLRDGFTDRTLA